MQYLYELWFVLTKNKRVFMTGEEGLKGSYFNHQTVHLDFEVKALAPSLSKHAARN